MSGEGRGNLYLLTGLVIGVALGISYAWLISPIQYIDTPPSSLAESHKEPYRLVVARAYMVEHDISRARARAILIDPESPASALAAQAQRMIAANASAEDARAVAVLSADLAQGRSSFLLTPSPTSTPESTATAPVGTITGTVEPVLTTDPALEAGQAVRTATLPPPTATATIAPKPTTTLTPLPTFTPRPTSTATTELSAPFILKSQRKACDGSLHADLVVFQVNDANGDPLPGVKISITGGDQVDIFFTGLAPEINLGYADYKTSPGSSYAIQVGETSEVVRITAQGDCGFELVFSEEQ